MSMDLTETIDLINNLLPIILTIAIIGMMMNQFKKIG